MIWAIGDLHFDSTNEKSMDIFGENWESHDKKIVKNWIENVQEDDLVLLPGDISWALKLNEAIPDLERIDKLPGDKIILKGNHDYWWGSLNKLNALGMQSIDYLFNNSFIYKKYAIVGTRGWLPNDAENFTEKDEKILRREVIRLENSIKSIQDEHDEIIAILHFPPFNSDGTTNEFVDVMKNYDVKTCIYAHLHAEGHNFIQEGNIDGIDFHCVSSDYLNFELKQITVNGE